MRNLALVVLLVIFAGVCAAGSMTTLTVEVKTLSGSPVDRASVIVKFVKGRAKMKLGKKILKTWETRTNQEGIAKIPPIPQGSIRVQGIAKGYQTFGEIFDIDDDQKTLEIKLNPPQEQYSSHQ